VSLHEAMASGFGSGDEEVGRDDLCFDDHMAQQEHGARSRYRQLVAHLHYNSSQEVDGERGSGVQERMREGIERSTRLGGRTQRQQRRVVLEDLGRDTIEDNIEGCSMESPSTRDILGASQEIQGRTSTPSTRTPPQSTSSPASKAKVKINGN
jgi:hypothetical protein